MDEAARALGVSASGNATSNGPIQRVFTRHQLVDVVNAHPRIGAAAQTLSALSRLEQGVTAATTIATPEQAATTPTTSLADTLRTLNDAYEQRYGFKFVVFVNGRTREEIVPVMRARIERYPAVGMRSDHHMWKCAQFMYDE